MKMILQLCHKYSHCRAGKLKTITSLNQEKTRNFKKNFFLIIKSWEFKNVLIES